MTNQNLRSYHMIGHAHIDPIWRWTKTEGAAEALATFQSAVNRLQEFPDVCFVASSAQIYDWVRQTDPRLFADIKKLVATGRWNLVGGWWVEADVTMPDGESLVRQGLYGQRFFLDHFGRQASIGFSPDTFGHPLTLPQILVGQNLPNYFFMRPDPAENNTLPGLIFDWQGPDGSQVLTFRILDAYNGEAADLAPRMNIYDHYENWPYAIFYGVGNHGGGPTIAAIREIQNMAQRHTGIVFSSLDAYVERIRDLDRSWPVVSGDLHNHSRGCYSACSEIKQLVRLTETGLLLAEKMQMLAVMLLAEARTRDLTAAWKKLLFNQFHDILCGTSIAEAHIECRRELYAAQDAAADCTAVACRLLAQQLNTAVFPEQSSPFVLFNPNSFPIHEWVEVEMQRLNRDIQPAVIDAEGHTLTAQCIHTAGVHVPERVRMLFRAELPAMGYRALAFDFARALQPSTGGVQATTWTMENERLRITLDQKTGAIASLETKADSREWLSAPAALALVLQDDDDTWGHRTLAYDQVLGHFAAPLITILESGPERCRVQVCTQYAESRLTQEFILLRNEPYVDVRVTVDWREACKMLKLSFPTVLKNGAATFSAPYGFVQRPMNGEEQPGQTWIDISGQDERGSFGLAILNDCKYGYSVLPGEIRITVLHSPIWSHHQPQVAQPEDGYRHMEQGISSFRYRILPHAGDWRNASIPQQAAAFLSGAQLYLTHRHSGGLACANSAVSIDRDSIVVTAWKAAESGDGMILRCVEMIGQATAATIRLPLLQRVIAAAFRPCEIKSFFIPIDPTLPVAEVNLLEEG